MSSSVHTAGVWVAGFGMGVFLGSYFSVMAPPTAAGRAAPDRVPAEAAGAASSSWPPAAASAPPARPSQLGAGAARPGNGGSDRLIVVCTMSYQHIFQRPNLARTAAQLQQAGGRVLWVVIEDTHSLRKLASMPEHYRWIVDDTRAYVATLGVDAVYIADESPFPKASPRSPKIETHQRNLGLAYAYDVVDNATVAARHAAPPCPLAGARGEAARKAFREGKVDVTEAEAADWFACPVVYIADDDNVYMPELWPALRRIMRVALFPTGNMGYDGIEGPVVAPAPIDPRGSLGGRLTGFNVWHGSDPDNPRGWDKTGGARRFPGDMAGLAFNAALQPKFTGPRYGFHETDIIQQTGVRAVEQIEGTAAVLAHHIHNEKTAGRLCYPVNWNYTDPAGVWVNVVKGTTHLSREAACGGCAPQPGQKDFRGCKGFRRPR